MGCSSLADMVTGLAMSSETPAVAVVIAKRTGGYPDAVKAAAAAPIHYDDMFVPVSLPILGYAGSYGDFEPETEQTSVEWACRIAGAANWQELSATALSFQHGGARMWQSRPLPGFNPGAPEPTILGLAVMSRATWNLLTELSAMTNDDGEIDLVLQALEDAGQRQATAHEGPTWFDILNLRQLSFSRDWTFADGRQVEMPELARAMGDMDGMPISGLLRSFLRETNRKGDWSRDTLRGICGLRAMKYGLEALNRPLMPSTNGGQHLNSESVAIAATSAIEQAAHAMVVRCQEHDSEQAFLQLQALSNLIEGLKDRLRSALSEARPRDAGGAFHP